VLKTGEQQINKPTSEKKQPFIQLLAAAWCVATKAR
jgi:hypothetical protein